MLITASFLTDLYSYVYDPTAMAYVAGVFRAMILAYLVLPPLPVACLVLPTLGARLVWRLTRPQAAIVRPAASRLPEPAVC